MYVSKVDVGIIDFGLFGWQSNLKNVRERCSDRKHQIYLWEVNIHWDVTTTRRTVWLGHFYVWLGICNFWTGGTGRNEGHCSVRWLWAIWVVGVGRSKAKMTLFIWTLWFQHLRWHEEDCSHCGHILGETFWKHLPMTSPYSDFLNPSLLAPSSFFTSTPVCHHSITHFNVYLKFWLLCCGTLGPCWEQGQGDCWTTQNHANSNRWIEEGGGVEIFFTACLPLHFSNLNSMLLAETNEEPASTHWDQIQYLHSCPSATALC